MSIVEFSGQPSWSLDVSKTWESAKCLWVEAVGLIVQHLYPQAFCALPSFACIKGPLFFCEIVDVDHWVWQAAILVSRCKQNWKEYKMPVGRSSGVDSPPPPLLTGILCFIRFCLHKETKMYHVRPLFFCEIVDDDCWVWQTTILVSWCKQNCGEYKMPMGRGSGVNSPPPPLPTGILYSPQFRLHQETKMVAHQKSTRVISQ